MENAVDAFKSGAFDYLIKPVMFEELASKIERLFEVRHLHIENQALRRALQRRGDLERVVGSSRVLHALQNTVRKVAITNSNVLLCGESGTGKELFARAIHKAALTPNNDSSRSTVVRDQLNLWRVRCSVPFPAIVHIRSAHCSTSAKALCSWTMFPRCHPESNPNGCERLRIKKSCRLVARKSLRSDPAAWCPA
ncbi:MAG: sigma 54-interacting transcriptional regulator, partial [Planctomycetaceae bacterium]